MESSIAIAVGFDENLPGAKLVKTEEILTQGDTAESISAEVSMTAQGLNLACGLATLSAWSPPMQKAACSTAQASCSPCSSSHKALFAGSSSAQELRR